MYNKYNKLEELSNAKEIISKGNLDAGKKKVEEGKHLVEEDKSKY